jgi:hypothetical protein
MILQDLLICTYTVVLCDVQAVRECVVAGLEQLQQLLTDEPTGKHTNSSSLLSSSSRNSCSTWNLITARTACLCSY